MATKKVSTRKSTHKTKPGTVIAVEVDQNTASAVIDEVTKAINELAGGGAGKPRSLGAAANNSAGEAAVNRTFFERANQALAITVMHEGTKGRGEDGGDE